MAEDHCDKGAEIESLQKGQVTQEAKMDLILHNQQELSTDLRGALDRLTSIIEEDIGTRKDVEQLKKDREILFDMQRADVVRIDAIEIRNARCDGAGIFENFPTMWNWYQQHKTAAESVDAIICAMKKKVDKVHAWYLGEMGWRRFIPAALTIISALLAIYIGVANISHKGVAPVFDPTHKTSVGMP